MSSNFLDNYIIIGYIYALNTIILYIASLLTRLG